MLRNGFGRSKHLVDIQTTFFYCPNQSLLNSTKALLNQPNFGVIDLKDFMINFS